MIPADPDRLTGIVKESLKDQGFIFYGIAPAGPHPEDAEEIAKWTSSGMNGSMSYLERNNDKRADISLLVPGARSVIVAALNYFNNDLPDDTFFIARYARGKDYHTVVREKLYKVLALIKSEVNGVTGRVFVDSAPVTEKAWAIRAGLGWRGRNSLIINKDSGSFFVLGEIVITAELIYDKPFINNLCGNCRKCIDSCPAGAINENHTIDARKCISYNTIENREDRNLVLLKEKAGNMIFGCDRCQEVCPWNEKPVHHSVPDFQISDELRTMTKNDWLTLSEEKFTKLFSGTPIERAGYKGLMSIIFNIPGSK